MNFQVLQHRRLCLLLTSTLIAAELTAFRLVGVLLHVVRQHSLVIAFQGANLANEFLAGVNCVQVTTEVAAVHVGAIADLKETSQRLEVLTLRYLTYMASGSLRVFRRFWPQLIVNVHRIICLIFLYQDEADLVDIVISWRVLE